MSDAHRSRPQVAMFGSDLGFGLPRCFPEGGGPFEIQSGVKWSENTLSSVRAQQLAMVTRKGASKLGAGLKAPTHCLGLISGWTFVLVTSFHQPTSNSSMVWNSHV